MKRIQSQINSPASDATHLSGGCIDYCTREGADRIKAQLESYWRARGQDVAITVLCFGFHPAIRAARYDVRSNMINGMPKLIEHRHDQSPPESDKTLNRDTKIVSGLTERAEPTQNGYSP